MSILALTSHDLVVAKNSMTRYAMTRHSRISEPIPLQQPQGSACHGEARFVAARTTLRAAAHTVLPSQSSMSKPMKLHTILGTSLKTAFAAALATGGAMAFAETDGERALRLENERQINELNTRIMIENRNADDAVRLQMDASRNTPAPAAVSPQAATMARYAAQKQAAEQLLGMPVLSYVSFQALQSGVPAAARKEIDGRSPRPIKVPGLLGGDAELDANALYRQGNVLQFSFTTQLDNGRGYVGRRLHATCAGSPAMLIQSSQHFALTRSEAARMARDPAHYGFSEKIQAARLSGESLRRVQELCLKAKPAKFEMSVAISESGSTWSSVPVKSIQRSAITGRVGWAVLNNSAASSAQFINAAAWKQDGAPIQRSAALAGSFGGGMQWSASCTSGEQSTASIAVDQFNKVISASPVNDDGRLMKSMPDHTRLAFEFACAAAGAS